MVRSRLSVSSKKGLRKMKSKSKASVTLRRAVDEVLTKRAETKHVQRLSDATVIASTMAIANTIHIIPPVVQGAGGAQRIGDRITVKKFDITLRMCINDVGGRAFPQGVYFDTFLFNVKGKTSFTGAGAPTLADFQRFFENNGIYKQYEGLIQDFDYRVNDDIINLVYKKRQLMNTSCSTDGSDLVAVQPSRVMQNNQNSVFSIHIPGLASRGPKTWVYDSAADVYPRNCNLFAIVVCTDAGGGTPVGAGFTQTEGIVWSTVHMDFIDM